MALDGLCQGEFVRGDRGGHSAGEDSVCVAKSFGEFRGRVVEIGGGTGEEAEDELLDEI